MSKTSKEVTKDRAVIYARFSPRKNAEECESCETQLSYCQQYCQKHGYAVVGYYEDKAISGSEEDRPGLWQAIEALRRGMVLVVYKTDRLARDVYLGECIRRAVYKTGATIEAVLGGVNGTTPEDTLIRQVLSAFAEYERKIIAMRTKYAMLHHQKQGRRMSNLLPYGWLPDQKDYNRMIPNDYEQRIIQRVKELHDGGMKMRTIAQKLTDEGWKPRKVKGVVNGEVAYHDGKWCHVKIARILQRIKDGE